jgi:hypothetical protein
MTKEITKCPKCGNARLLTASGYGSFEADDEPYEDGKREIPEVSSFETDDILALYCENCDRIVEIWMGYVDIKSCNEK